MQPAPPPPARLDFSLKRRRADARAEASRVTQGRARRAGGPQDRALYNCSCGYVFTAAVSTSVGCPHCGTSQAW